MVPCNSLVSKLILKKTAEDQGCLGIKGVTSPLVLKRSYISIQNECMNEQFETNTFVVSSLAESAMTELYRSKRVDKDPADWGLVDNHLRQVIVNREKS